MEQEIELLKDQMAKQKEVLEILMRQSTSGGIPFVDTRTLRRLSDAFRKEDEEPVETENVNV